MIDYIETNVEFILEYLHVPFPLDRESGSKTKCCEDTVSLPIRFPTFRPDPLFSEISSCNELTYCSLSNS